MKKDFPQSESALAKTIRDHIEDEDGDVRKVETLTLKNIRVISIKNQLLISGLSNLKIADFRNSGLTQMLGFESCLKLKELYLCENRIGKIKNIQHLKELQILDLRGNHMIELFTPQGIHNMPKSLTQVRLGFNHLIDITEMLAKLRTKNLKNLWILQNNFIKPKQVEQMKSLLKSKSQVPEDFYYD